MYEYIGKPIKERYLRLYTHNIATYITVFRKLTLPIVILGRETIATNVERPKLGTISDILSNEQVN